MAFAESFEENPFPKGIMLLAAEFSRPFRRLDKYPAVLQELERHLEEFHSDRGNTQRSVAVYTELAVSTIHHQLHSVVLFRCPSASRNLSAGFSPNNFTVVFVIESVYKGSTTKGD